MRRFWKQHPVAAPLLSSLLLGILLVFGRELIYIVYMGRGDWQWNIMEQIVLPGLLAGGLFVYPAVLSILELVYLFGGIKNPIFIKQGKITDVIVLFLGVIYTAGWGLLVEIDFTADWTVRLANRAVHTPVFTESYVTLTVLAAMAVLGYLVLTYVQVQKLPPLVIVCAMAGMYLGIVECMAWIIQLWKESYRLMCLAPFDFIVIGVKTVRNTILKWNASPAPQKVYDRPWLQWCNDALYKSKRWPAAAFLLMWPLLGILIGVLALFGQRPDAVIKAWTETSDWNLSRRVAPQNIYYDEHYLCTVAAGGHEKVVRPKRLGVRHGHAVIVNRQLCVANAFEQILEERTPRFHRRLRRFYDTYGFPVAKMIHSPYIADVIYFIMKPLEWLFVIVLYFCDVNPENRIAVQYTGELPQQVKAAVG